MNRENTLHSFLANIKESWTWAKLTDRERRLFESRLRTSTTQKLIQGTFHQRYAAYTAMYDMFLAGLGYYEDCMNWRD